VLHIFLKMQITITTPAPIIAVMMEINICIIVIK